MKRDIFSQNPCFRQKVDTHRQADRQTAGEATSILSLTTASSAPKWYLLWAGAGAQEILSSDDQDRLILSRMDQPFDRGRDRDDSFPRL